MAETKYGFVDDGNIAFTPKKGCECDATNKEALDKVNEIIEGAPEELDTFKEVAEKFNNLQVTEIDLSKYATKEDIKQFPTTDDLKCFATKAEMESEFGKLGTFATQQYVDDAVSKIEAPSLDGYATELYVIDAIKAINHPTYDDTEVKERLTALEEKEDKDTVYDDTDIKARIDALEVKEDKDTLYDDTEIKAEIESIKEEKQNKGNYLTYSDESGRKVVHFNNNDIIGATPATDEREGQIKIDGSWVSLIHLNRWNVVDLGDVKTLTNINTPKDVRPTIQEKGQSGAEAHKMAYLEDIVEVSKENAILKDMVKNLIKAMANKENDDVFATGDIKRDSVEATTIDYKSINGNISLYDVKATNAPLLISAPKGDVTITDVTTEGKTMEGEVKKNNFFVEADGNIVIKGCKFEAECYNAVHMNNNGVCCSDNVTVEDTYLKKANNNGFNVLATKDNAVITYKDVTIGEAKNAFRFSNYKDAKNVVVNFENVEVGKVAQEFMLLEDYRTRKEVDGVLNYPNDLTDLFDAEHMTFNFKNVTVEGVKLTSENILNNLHIVVGKPSLGVDIDVTEACKGELKINFLD